MNAMSSDGNVLTANKPVTLHERYFRVMIVVASCWTLLGAATMAFWLDAPKTSEMYVKMKFLTGGCLFVAAGIYSALLPMYYIAKRHREERD